jgi:hypothetical protein
LIDLSDSLKETMRIDWLPFDKPMYILDTFVPQSGPMTFRETRYGYDALHQRVEKIDVNNSIRTAYLRDASGNIMAVYEYRQGSWSHAEQHLYGADRLGVHNKPVALAASGHNYMFLATKKYELSNHLGNVMAVVTDRRFVNSTGTFATAEAVTERSRSVVSATDYFVFGSAMPSREYNGSAYDFGFNTQMESPEILAGHTTAMYWEYDGRIGRRWELDPLCDSWESPYSTNHSNPIRYTDISGLYGTRRKADKMRERAISAGMIASPVGMQSDGTYGFYAHTYEIIRQTCDPNNGCGFTVTTDSKFYFKTWYFGGITQRISSIISDINPFSRAVSYANVAYKVKKVIRKVSFGGNDLEFAVETPVGGQIEATTEGGTNIEIINATNTQIKGKLSKKGLTIVEADYTPIGGVFEGEFSPGVRVLVPIEPPIGGEIPLVGKAEVKAQIGGSYNWGDDEWSIDIRVNGSAETDWFRPAGANSKNKIEANLGAKLFLQCPEIFRE